MALGSGQRRRAECQAELRDSAKGVVIEIDLFNRRVK
jgi:hypothetical protein